MKINSLNNIKYCTDIIKNISVNTEVNNVSRDFGYKKYSFDNIKANYAPLNFTGNAPEIKKAYIITPEDELNLEKTNNNSYIVEKETNTELIYGKDAYKYLKDKRHFEKDTHIIFPKKAEGKITVDGKITEIKENSAILIEKNSNASVEITKGYPMILTSGNDFGWYSRHSKFAKDEKVKNKYFELQKINAHLYDGEIPKSKFSEVIKTKLIDKGIAKESSKDYIKFEKYYAPDFQANELKKNGFSDEEVNSIMPLYTLVRNAKLDAKPARHGMRHNLNDETVKKLMDEDLIYKSKPKNDTDKRIFWKKNYCSEGELKSVLKSKPFSRKECKKIIKGWKQDNKTGYDLTGFKPLNDKISMYSLDKKVNNWAIEPSCWLTNSTELAAKNSYAPSMGTSIVQTDITKPTPMSELRSGEKLHKHPNKRNKKQFEIYLVTSGCAALNIVKNGVPEVKIIKEGEVAVISPDVKHCVNSVIGEYEQVVSQVPSAFQYGLAFKKECELPSSYDEKTLAEIAAEKLLKAKSEI